MQHQTECRDALRVLVEGTEQLGIPLSATQAEQFTVYCSALMEANRKFNLTGIKTADGIARALFLDSLTVVAALPSELAFSSLTPLVADVGSGAGFPALPLKIIFPSWRMVLIESTGKKAKFLQEVAGTLGMDGVTVQSERVETVSSQVEWRERADLCTARAVASISTLIELCAPLVRVGGFLAFPKSGQIEGEIRDADEAERRLKLRLLAVVPVDSSLGLGEGRATVTYVKTARTPTGYPRRIGLAQSRPIGGKSTFSSDK